MSTTFFADEILGEDVIVHNISATSTEAVEIERDVLEKSREELEKINKALDEEEAALISSMEADQARLDEIRAIRMSF